MAERNIGGLWRKQGAKGVFYSGKIDGIGELVVFANKYATPENRQPNFNIYLSKKQGEPAQTLEQEYKQPQPPVMTKAERSAYAEEVGMRDDIKPEDLPFRAEL